MGLNDERNSGLIVDQIHATILQEIEKASHSIEQGSITLIVQDTRLIQMDIVRRVQFVKPQGKHALNVQFRLESQNQVSEQILAALKGMRYGQVALLVSREELYRWTVRKSSGCRSSKEPMALASDSKLLRFL